VSIDFPYKFGLVIYGSYPEVLQSTDTLLKRLVEVSKDTSFDVIELPVVDETGLWGKIRRIKEEAGLDVVASAGPSCVLQGWNLSSTDSSLHKTSIKGMQKAIDYAYAIGSKELVFLSGKDPGESERGKARISLLKALEELMDYSMQKARDYVLVLSLELADRNITHNQLIGPTNEALDLMIRAKEKSEAVNVTLDMSHIAQLGETFEQATSNLRGLVSHAHVANVLVRDTSRPEFGDKHPRFGLPGGEYDVPDIARFIELLFERCFTKATYFPYGKPVVSLEVKPTEDVDAEVSLAGAKRALFEASHYFNGRRIE
jgi:sugar phosphate isomerase/epimerase